MMRFLKLSVAFLFLASSGLPSYTQTVSKAPTTEAEEEGAFKIQSRSTTPDMAQAGNAHTESERCQEFNKCTSGLTQLREAVGRSHWQEACRIITPIYQCQEEAIEDCRQQRVLSVKAFTRLENAYAHTVIKMHNFCDKAKPGNTAKSPEESHTVTCSEYRQCWATRDQFVFAARNKQRRQACRYVTPIYQCTSAALADCKSKGTLPMQTLKVMEKYTLQAKTLMDEHCSYADEPIADGEYNQSGSRTENGTGTTDGSGIALSSRMVEGIDDKDRSVKLQNSSTKLSLLRPPQHRRSNMSKEVSLNKSIEDAEYNTQVTESSHDRGKSPDVDTDNGQVWRNTQDATETNSGSRLSGSISWQEMTSFLLFMALGQCVVHFH